VQRYAFFSKSLELSSSLSDAAVGAHDAVPWNVTFGCRKNVTDKARRARIDVAVRLDETLWNCTNECEDARSARVDR
jgi:hypothetical protein